LDEDKKRTRWRIRLCLGIMPLYPSPGFYHYWLNYDITRPLDAYLSTGSFLAAVLSRNIQV
jgi:hypothetical protein